MEIIDSGLRGRGGGGFPTGKKWAQRAARQNAGQKYVVCNGDEGDPGAFMDQEHHGGQSRTRMLGGHDDRGDRRAARPRAISMSAPSIRWRLSACRPPSIRQRKSACSARTSSARNFPFDIHINRGAGAFVCGEGSALTASIEGKRGMPRTKPPRTVEHGLCAKAHRAQQR